MIIMIISFTKRLLTNQESRSETTEKVHITTSSFVPFLLPTFWHCRLLTFPVCVIIIGEDSLVITSRQHRIDWFLQCVFQGLVHSTFLGSIMLFSSWKEDSLYQTNQIGILVDSEIVLSTRYGKTRVFINKTLSTETSYQQDLVNRDLLSTSLIIGKVGPGMWCDKFNSTSN